jgi:hypothetical protein
MTLPARFSAVRLTEEFKLSYRLLPPVIQEAVNGALRDLVSEAIPESRCLRPLKGSNNPNVYTLKPTWNEPYLLSFEAVGDIAVLRGVSIYEVI